MAVSRVFPGPAALLLRVGACRVVYRHVRSRRVHRSGDSDAPARRSEPTARVLPGCAGQLARSCVQERRCRRFDARGGFSHAYRPLDKHRLRPKEPQARGKPEQPPSPAQISLAEFQRLLAVVDFLPRKKNQVSNLGPRKKSQRT